MKIMNDNSKKKSGAGADASTQSQQSSALSNPLPPIINVREVAIADILIPPERKPDPDIVGQLATSIADIGLLNPILLTTDLQLVAGRNRIAAAIKLGLTHIEARIETWGSIDRQLAEIDENLIRRRPPLLERGRLLARRKELYEAIHPEARQHVRGGHAKAASAANEIISPAPGFASDAAAKLGTSERTVQEEIRIAKELAPGAVALIQGTALEDEKVKLMELTRLPHNQQTAVAQLLVDGRVKSVRAAIATLRRGAEPADTSKGKPAKSKAPKEGASATTPSKREASTPQLSKPDPMENKDESGGARAALLQHLEDAAKLLPDLRTEGRPPGVLADEVDATVEHLANLRGHVDALIELLASRGPDRRRTARPRVNVEARPGRSEPQLSSRWDLKHVWTLHRNPAALHGPVLAVRRRVLKRGFEMAVEIARRAVALSEFALQATGCARTYGQVRKHGCDVSVWVYDHCPTEAERAEWLRRRALENAALTSPPPDVWMLREGPKPGGPDQAVRCKTTRAWRTYRREGELDAERTRLEVKISRVESAWIDLLELATKGKASDLDVDDLWFFRDQPTAEELQLAGKERRRRMEEARIEAERARRAKAAAEEQQREAEEWARRYAEQFRQQFNGNLQDDAGEEALARFGLTLPCTAEDVNQAFRKAVKTEKPHPDQGGTSAAFRELVELKEQALMYVENTGGRQAA